MAGDINLCLDPEVDCTPRVQWTVNAQRKSFQRKLHQHQLMDVWRIQHPKIRKYLFYAAVHGTYSRIDLFLVEHRMLEAVISSNIQIVTFSDHAPVTIKLKMEGVHNRNNIWRLNEELIQDAVAVDRIKKELKQYFKKNSSEEITEATVREAHKAYIRGTLIAIGAETKKERRRKEKRRATQRDL